MDVKIGVIYTSKELVVELDGGADEAWKAVDDALNGTGALAWLTDTKGRRFGVPTDKIAYIEIGSDEDSRKVGFGR